MNIALFLKEIITLTHDMSYSCPHEVSFNIKKVTLHGGTAVYIFVEETCKWQAFVYDTKIYNEA